MQEAVNQREHAFGIRERLGFWLRNDAARLLFPSRCLACEAPGVEGLDLCPVCLAALPWQPRACIRCALPLPQPAGDDTCAACLTEPPPLAACHAACRYQAPLDRLLPRFKFHGDLAAGRLMSQLMARAFAGLPRPAALVPVPLHRARLRQRGYDQALELAKPLAAVLEVDLQAGLLRRQRHTRAQSTLDAASRRENLLDAFVVSGSGGLPGHVVLVDDVMTTGATLHAAAEALLDAGVRRVDAWVCGRAL
ncbi:ComF family protein [Lysobacter sp. GX 14042]|uniref:ComF family protein n=1 Tax=Lysobacter sp. GX 14042 TaxID=2907155 RepID=UPI001F36C44E|nr:ComF family protein [Lysobacter sp. GX 14042]MCE7032389.1 ComF family protein [Lysobacter sp. GX 14042]